MIALTEFTDRQSVKPKRKSLGRPRVVMDASKIARLHAPGRSIREIADELAYSRSLVHKTLANAKSRGAVTTTT